MYRAPKSVPLRLNPIGRMAGLSMIELLVVMAVAAILLGVATTSYKSITTSSRITGEINGLLGDMQYARSEAIRQGTNVVVCVSQSNGNDCTANDMNWQDGWIVFIDAAGIKKTNGNATLILRRQAPFTGSTPDTLSDGLTSNLSFDRDGLAIGLLATMSGVGGAIIPLHDATNNATKTRCLWITNIGSVTVQQPSTLPNCT